MRRAGHDPEIDELRRRVDCRVLLEIAGWSLDGRTSTTRAAKYFKEISPAAKEIVIVTHGGRGWFDAQDGKKGDVFALAQYLWKENFGQVRRRLRPLAGLEPKLAGITATKPGEPIDAPEVWASRQPPKPGSPAWGYMLRDRALPAATLERALRAGILREGVYGTVWAAHRNAAGEVIGWEMRGPQWKGFSKGGTKGLCWIGRMATARRVCVAEAWIDMLSLATLEGWPEGTVYASTGGGYGPLTAEILAAVVPRTARLVAASDTGRGGDLLAKRLQDLAASCGLGYGRRIPLDKDWNLDLQNAAAAALSPPSLPPTS